MEYRSSLKTSCVEIAEQQHVTENGKLAWLLEFNRGFQRHLYCFSVFSYMGWCGWFWSLWLEMFLSWVRSPCFSSAGRWVHLYHLYLSFSQSPSNPIYWFPIKPHWFAPHILLFCLFPETRHQLDRADKFVGYPWTEVSHAETTILYLSNPISNTDTIFLYYNIIQPTTH